MTTETAAPPLEPGIVLNVSPDATRTRSRVICSKRTPESPWLIESWTTDQEEATRRAEQLVTPPYMDAAAAVAEIGGWTGVPIFFPEFVVARCACGALVHLHFYLASRVVCAACAKAKE